MAATIQYADGLPEERKFLSDVAPKLTEKLLEKIWRMEDLL